MNKHNTIRSLKETLTAIAERGSENIAEKQKPPLIFRSLFKNETNEQSSKEQTKSHIKSMHVALNWGELI